MPDTKSVASYIAKLKGEQKAIVEQLHRLMLETAPKVKHSIKWSQPVYEEGGPFAHIKAFASHVNFGFWRGAQLPDPKKLLSGAGERMRHIKITSAKDINRKAYQDFIKTAIELNAKYGDPTKNK
jgi:hypothetical protein